MNAMLTRARRKRGIVLLVVISLLTLFILLGVTYTLVSTQYRDAALHESRRELYGDNPETEMELVLGQLLYGSLVRTSLLGHDLLGDLYGNDGVAADVVTATAATPPASSGIVTLDVTASAVQPFQRSLSSRYDYYNGRVLTFTSGQAKGVSARIMHYTPGTPAKVVIETAEGVAPSNLAGSQVLINGAPFNGTGIGYDDTSKKLEKTDPTFGQLVALMPHFAQYFNNSAKFVKPVGALNQTVNYGGEDETWDAPDYQNMFLAMVPPAALTDPNIPILPSFHRPELVRYWANQSSSGWAYDSTNPDAYKNFRRQIVMRPMPWDHPNFTGSNPNFIRDPDPATFDQAEDDAWVAALMSNQGWDVDNDNDGIPDSIWIDPGLPVLTSADGRRFKRLVAILVKDMDGRINLNTAGNLTVATENNLYQPDTAISGQFMAGKNPASATTVTLSRGIGYGPETDIRRILSTASDSSNYLSLITRRYGDGKPGTSGVDDQLSKGFKQYNYPSDHTAGLSVFGSSPPDVWGRSAMALDYYGQPIWANNTGRSETLDDPYEMQVDSRTAYSDQPYTISEMERLLRFNDPDAPTISSRLNVSPLNGSSAVGQRARESVTTAGWHVTAPSMIAPRELRAGSTPPLQGTILDLYARKGLSDANWLSIVPFEIRHGEPFNLNRLFGDGLDGNSNNIIDEPGETETYDYTNESPFAATIDNAAVNPYATRQMYARHLYSLAMLLKNPAYDYDLDNDGTATAAETARALAQWAINVVDFRDSDCINTPFVYDTNPFDGWTSTPNGLPDGSTNNVVWGAERPELLITETVAWHDRRTEDTDLDEDGDQPKKKTTDTTDPDTDYDQRLRPASAVFIELFNPWIERTGGTYNHWPQELYWGQQGVTLNQLNASGNPVWRMIVDRRAQGNRNNPDEPRPEALTGPATGLGDIERSIYFANPAGAGAAGGEVFHTNVPIAPLKPGRYAIVGSSGIADAGVYTNYVGRIKGQGDLGGQPLTMATTRQIRLRPNPNPDIATAQVEIVNNGNGFDLGFGGASPAVQRPIAIPINQPRSLSITDPIGGYTATGFVPSAMAGDIPDATGKYEPPLDKPLDKDRVGFEFLMQDGTGRPNFRTIHLQRLANPLLPHDANTNPYLTIDSSSIDVTAFNGASSPTDPGAKDVHKANFQTFQRGGSFPEADTPSGYNAPDPASADPANPSRNLWKRESARIAPTSDSTPATGTEHFFNYQLFHTIGYLNRQYHPYLTSTSPVPSAYRGAPSWENGTATAWPTFPWLTFNNRPYTNPMELMLVPRHSQYDMLTQFSMKVSTTNAHPYVNAVQNSQFNHLLNLFQTANLATDESGAALGPQLNRLLDFVEVPSPFVDTERWFPASTFTAGSAPSPSPASSYRPPFSSLSRHREPGRVNINTIFDQAVFNSAVAGIPVGTGLQTTWEQMLLSRQGYGTTAAQVYAADANLPSYFSQPFRSADAADMMPLPNLRTQSVHATLLRKRADSNEPLFASAASGASNEHMNADRNPYFRYQGYQKIGNTFTTHSNVFAVWMTVGYFEVTENGTPAVVDAGHPDGLQLGMELGADTGEIKRHRSFYIIDRSIPVGYQPGQKHNADRTVLLRRFIE